MAQKHKKKRNVGLVYEFAIRQFGERLVEGDQAGATDAAEFIQRNFPHGSILRREIELHDFVRSARGEQKPIAEKILRGIRDRVTRDTVQLDEARSSMYRDAIKTFGDDFFSRHRITEYRAVATTQMFFDAVRADDLCESSRLEEVLAVWLSSSQVAPRQRPNVDAIVGDSAKKTFVHRYGNALSTKQLGFLEQMVRSSITGDRVTFERAARKEKKKIAKVLLGAKTDPDVNVNEESKKAYIEAVKKLAVLDCSADPEIVTEEILVYYDLCDRLEKK